MGQKEKDLRSPSLPCEDITRRWPCANQEDDSRQTLDLSAPRSWDFPAQTKDTSLLQCMLKFFQLKRKKTELGQKLIKDESCNNLSTVKDSNSLGMKV